LKIEAGAVGPRKQKRKEKDEKEKEFWIFVSKEWTKFKSIILHL
jgi:hypothetical protein